MRNFPAPWPKGSNGRKTNFGLAGAGVFAAACTKVQDGREAELRCGPH